MPEATPIPPPLTKVIDDLLNAYGSSYKYVASLAGLSMETVRAAHAGRTVATPTIERLVDLHRTVFPPSVPDITYEDDNESAEAVPPEQEPLFAWFVPGVSVGELLNVQVDDDKRTAEAVFDGVRIIFQTVQTGGGDRGIEVRAYRSEA